MLAKEEMPFTKYPAIVELEKRLGVSLGSTYGTEHKCQKFTNTIGDCLQDADTLDEIRASRFVTVSLDGSMDNSCKFFCLADVSDATSIGIQTLLMERCAKLDLRNQLSPKRLRELQILAELMEESIRKPDKANGTRWLQHKSCALCTLLLGYPVIVAHLKSMSSDKSNLKPVDKIRFSGYVKKLTSFKFVLHTLFYKCLLNPLASFSCSLQADSVDLSFCIAKLKSLLSSLEHLKGDTLDSTSELAKFIMSVDCEQDRSEFRGVMLTAVRQNVLDAFHNSWSAYVDAISSCLENRFDDLQSSSVMKGVKILDVSAWPSDNSSDSFGLEEISGVIEHFKPLIPKHDIVVASIIDDLRAFKTTGLLHDGSIPLHMAAKKGHHEVVVVLMAYNADTTIKDEDNKTAFDLMVNKYRDELSLIFSKECAITKERLSDAIKQVTVAEENAQRASIAEHRATVSNKKAIADEKRANVAEEQATAAQKRASVAKVAEMEVTAAVMMATAADTRAEGFKERANQAEDAVKTLQESARISDIRIAELVQTNRALGDRATRAEHQIQDLTMQCRQLQEQLDKAPTPLWHQQQQQQQQHSSSSSTAAAAAAQQHSSSTAAAQQQQQQQQQHSSSSSSSSR
eukprot:Em0527g1a